MRLAELSDIHSGYTARGRLEPLPEGGVPALQLRDVGTEGAAPGPDFQRYDLGKLPDRYFVRGGGPPATPSGASSMPGAVQGLHPRDAVPEVHF
jgi:hypothetical protein